MVSDQSLAQVVLRTCGVSILGDIEKLSGHSPGQPALDGPIPAGGVDKVTSRAPFQSQLFRYTLFCDTHSTIITGMKNISRP